MKFLFSLIILLILIPVLIVGGGLALIYYTYFNPQPAEYQFLHEAEDISSIEYAEFAYKDGEILPSSIGFVLDTEGIMADLDKLDCHEGLSIDAIVTLAESKSFEGLVINYSDGSYEFVTPYISLNSSFNPQTVEELLNTKFYGYDAAEFAALLDEYGTDLPTELPDEIPEDILDQIPQ